MFAHVTPRPATVKNRIMIVDDHPIVREGMGQFLNAQPDLHLCCEAGDMREALALMPSCNPALVIIDITLNQESGLDLMKALRRNYPRVALLAMSQHDEAVFAEQALRAGANGYLMKQEATSSILRAIRLVLAGEVYLSNAMHSQLARRLTSPAGTSPNPVAGLSTREFEILHLLGLGFGTRQIADKLNRSIKTIETHRASLKEKLNLNNGTDLAHFAFQMTTKHNPEVASRPSTPE
jgi:two-component system, NarL family, response regulator FusR